MFLIHRHTATVMSLLLLSGCGGGGDDSESATPAPTPATVTLNGAVIDGPIAGATVCLDVDGDGMCGAGDPTSSPTNASGQYDISGITAAQLASGARLIAQIPVGAIDADQPDPPIATAYTMRAAADQGGVISPLTTMVLAGIDSGLTSDEAQARVAAQLGVPVTGLLTNYTTDPNATGNASLAEAARFIVTSLQQGDALTVETPTATSPSYVVSGFNFTDPQNWSMRYLSLDGTLADDGRRQYRDRRIEIVAGVQTPEANLYTEAEPAFRLLRQGFTLCDATTIHRTGSGSIYRSEFCGDETLARKTIEDVSGQPIAEVIRTILADPGNTLNALDPSSVGAAVMPAGAQIIRRSARVVEYAVRYMVADTPLNSSIAQLPSAYPGPVSGTVNAGNSVSLGNLPAVDNGPTRRPRAAFGADGTAHLYICELTDTFVSINCVPSGTGTWTSAPIHGVPVISFTGLPTTRSDRVFVEVAGLSQHGYRIKPQTTESSAARLNHVAFIALANALGIQAPTP